MRYLGNSKLGLERNFFKYYKLINIHLINKDHEILDESVKDEVKLCET